MRGSHQVTVRNNHVQYKFTVRRNITVLRGDSATGKTTLIEMVGAYEASGVASGVALACDVPCVVLSGNRWQENLRAIKGSIVFIDEGDPFVCSRDFARAIQKTDNYYVIATRSSLHALPYSVEEVYGIRNVTRQRYEQVKRLYSSLYRIYGASEDVTRPDVVVVEDEKAGYQFFKALCEKSGIKCVSAKGRDNIIKAVVDCGDESILVIADGAAIGAQMEELVALRQIRNVGFFLPESFEWLILSSGLVKDSDIPQILADPSAFIESREYFSWERFFDALLTRRTQETYLAYKKTRLNPAYLNDHEMGQIVAQVPVLETP